MEARRKIYLLVKQKDFDSLSNDIEYLTQKDFDEAAAEVYKNPKAKYNSTIFKLLAKFQKSSVSVQGSKSALKHRRNDIRA